MYAQLDGMQIFHIKYENIFIPVNSIFSHISIPSFYFIDACVQFEVYFLGIFDSPISFPHMY